MSERRGTKALELWCRRVTEGYSGVKIENMTTSWRDGLAFCAMIHHFRPDLIDFEKLNKSDVYYNNALAFTTAEKYLGIPALLDADDMAAYEVPDRLSILTYLSQFYQVFASQETHNGLKRSSSSHTDKTQVTKSSGPPPKMALVVGVPKRDPCGKCQLPVFLAERLMVGKKVYHRTCLKCARCGHQLTPGSFYETEIDEQYCCETCPDEEVNLSSGSAEELPLGNGGSASASFCSSPEPLNMTKYEASVIQSSPLKSPKSSIKERLAFFENNGIDDESDTKLLQKSLSDEEKSKSLQRNESSLGANELSCKSDMTLINPFINTVADEENFIESSFSMNKSKIGHDTTDLINVSLPPELPKSVPPSEKLNYNKKSEEKKRFSVSAQLVLGSLPHVTTVEKLEQQNILNLPTTGNKDTKLQINFSPNIIDNTNNNNTLNKNHQIEEKTVQFDPNCIESNLEFSDFNDNDCVTKDNLAEEFSKTTKTEDLHQEINRKDTTKTNNQFKIKHDEVEIAKKIKTFEDDLVELRTNTNEENPNVSLQLQDNNTTEVITNNKKAEEVSAKKPPVNDAESEIMLNEINASELIKNKSSGTETDEKETIVNKIELKTESLETSNIIDKVPLKTKTDKNDILSNNLDDKKEHLENNNSKENVNFFQTLEKNNSKTSIKEYPDDLNPFKSDDEEVIENNKENEELTTTPTISAKTNNLNPFDSSDDEVELEKSQKSKNTINSTHKVPPPRPPPPRILKNPFGSEDEDGIPTPNFSRHTSLSGSQNRKTPVPTPRSNISQPQNTTPEPTPRLGTEIITAIRSVSTTPNNATLPILRNSSEFYGSANSLFSNNTTPYNLFRNSDVRSSNNSLNLSAGGTVRSRKTRRAPLPPAPVKELFPSTETIDSSSKTSTPCSSTFGTPKSARKKRPAPAPPKPARLEASKVLQTQIDTESSQPKNLNNYPLQSESDSKLSDEEKALLEGKTSQSLYSIESDKTLSPSSRRSSKRLIPLDQELLEEHGLLQYIEGTRSQCDDSKQQDQQKSVEAHENETSVVYRRVLIPQNLETPTHEHNPLEHLGASPSLGERQLEKLKDNKEANNRNRQSQISVSSSGADDNESFFNKSAHGKWKRRKGPAPALPVPARKVLQMLPLQEIKHELEIIEVQQQGLEKQGVILEKMIRDRCERENGEPLNADETGDTASGSSTVENSKEVENLILQLFELVNEKNELFRRQAELMYLRRQHRLEQEQADLEYEIRSLMAQPERNKTDSDKAREEALIERLVEVVQLRNEVVECLEMDRLREAEEDQSIKQRLESHIAKRGDNIDTTKTLSKLSKKERKKQKEAKKLFKSKKLDADKDADESESNVVKQKYKKKKMLLIF